MTEQKKVRIYPTFVDSDLVLYRKRTSNLRLRLPTKMTMNLLRTKVSKEAWKSALEKLRTSRKFRNRIRRPKKQRESAISIGMSLAAKGEILILVNNQLTKLLVRLLKSLLSLKKVLALESQDPPSKNQNMLATSLISLNSVVI